SYFSCCVGQSGPTMNPAATICLLELVVAERGVVLFEACGGGCQVESGGGFLQGQTQFNQLCLDLVDGLGTEVTDVHQVSLGAGNEFTHSVDALTLEAVVGT